MTERSPTRAEISHAVASHGWRLHVGALHALIPVVSLRQAADAANTLVAVAGPGSHLRLDLRPDAVLATVGTPETSWVEPDDIDLALALTAAVRRLGLATEPLQAARSTQAIEIAIDALDADAIRPFWQAVLAYVPDSRGGGDLIDPFGVGPAVWFQQMDAPRSQRNRIHLDVSVPHDEVQRRLAAALTAGGRLVYDKEAPAFWVLADTEGNEACLCTWQGRDQLTSME